MTYVREQTSEELAAHMRSLQRMAGWFQPLADRLWREVEALQATIAEQAKMIEHLRGGPTPLYTAVDMANAARDGFRDGEASKSEPCDGCFMAEAEALRKDAERYRWLSEKFGVTNLPCAVERILAGEVYVADGKASIDAAIDAAMSKEG